MKCLVINSIIAICLHELNCLMSYLGFYGFWWIYITVQKPLEKFGDFVTCAFYGI